MGTSIGARCSNCEYHADTILIGYGMTPGRLAWPVLCRKCRAITTANYEVPMLRCEICASKSVLSVTTEPAWSGSGDVIEKSGFETVVYLTDGRYLCPVCDRLELRFGEPEFEVLWD